MRSILIKLQIPDQIPRVNTTKFNIFFAYSATCQKKLLNGRSGRCCNHALLCTCQWPGNQYMIAAHIDGRLRGGREVEVKASTFFFISTLDSNKRANKYTYTCMYLLPMRKRVAIQCVYVYFILYVCVCTCRVVFNQSARECVFVDAWWAQRSHYSSARQCCILVVGRCLAFPDLINCLQRPLLSEIQAMCIQHAADFIPSSCRARSLLFLSRSAPAPQPLYLSPPLSMPHPIIPFRVALEILLLGYLIESLVMAQLCWTSKQSHLCVWIYYTLKCDMWFLDVNFDYLSEFSKRMRIWLPTI